MIKTHLNERLFLSRIFIEISPSLTIRNNVLKLTINTDFKLIVMHRK